MKKNKPGRSKGHKVTEETKHKISKTMAGRKLSNQHKQNIGKSMLGIIPKYQKNKIKINQQHGASGTPEYTSYNSMCTRCYNPNHKYYKNYNGRGIIICDRWLNPITGFTNFLDDMGTRPTNRNKNGTLEYSLERKNNEDSYTPENCVWATHKTQMHNSRRVIHFIAKNKKRNLEIKTKNISKFAREQGLHDSCIRRCLTGERKIHKGWTFTLIT